MSRVRIDARRPSSGPEGVTESELLVQHRRGDTRSFAEFVARYRRRVYGYLVRCGIEDGARDDLFQDVFTSIHGAVAHYRPELPVAPWVFTIVANIVRSHYRKARVREQASSTDWPGEAETAPDSESLAEARETAVWLERAIAALPLAQREVILLCCVEQLPQPDVATALGMPVNTVKTHLRRGRITLAEALARRKSASGREGSS